MSAGKFIDFYLAWKDPSGAVVPDPTQATEILNKATALVNGGSKGVAIIYSANSHQTATIEKAYSSGGWQVQIGGSNQANVMRYMEKQLATTFTALQGKMRIAPISTLNANSLNGAWPVGQWEQVLAADFARIEQWLNDGWDILGWQNQGTVNTPYPYAIGGGVVKNMPVVIKDYIQNHLKVLKAKYT